MIFAITMTLYLLIQSYVLFRFYQLLPKKRWIRLPALIFAICLTFSMPTSIFLARELPLWLIRPMYLIGAGWMVGLIYFFIPVIAMDLFRLINRFAGFVSKEKLTKLRTNNGKVSLALIVFYTIFFYMGNHTYHDKARREYHFNLADMSLIEAPLACPLNKGNSQSMTAPIKAVMISDLHLGHTIRRDEMEAWAKLINAENPDYIFISGDVIDNDVRPLYADNMPEAINMLEAQKGIYAVLGNHEYIAGVENSIEFFNKTKVKLLRDEVILLPENIYLVGRDDKMNLHRAELSALLEGLDPAVPKIVLDHQPFKVAEMAKAGDFLQFSGHTHDGQVWPYKYATKMINGISSGLLTLDNSQFLVSSGIGLWGGKFRIGTRSDYMVVTFCQ